MTVTMASHTCAGNGSFQKPEPFIISIPDERLQDLKAKLTNLRLPDEWDDSNWTEGVPPGEIRRLVEYWKSGYDWRVQEQKLNALPHFRVPIAMDRGYGELDIHFIHSRSENERAIPLLFIHGCRLFLAISLT